MFLDIDKHRETTARISQDLNSFQSTSNLSFFPKKAPKSKEKVLVHSIHFHVFCCFLISFVLPRSCFLSFLPILCTFCLFVFPSFLLFSILPVLSFDLLLLLLLLLLRLWKPWHSKDSFGRHWPRGSTSKAILVSVDPRNVPQGDPWYVSFITMATNPMGLGSSQNTCRNSWPSQQSTSNIFYTIVVLLDYVLLFCGYDLCLNRMTSLSGLSFFTIRTGATVQEADSTSI